MLMVGCAHAQLIESDSLFRFDTGMATTDDGAHLYPSSSLRLKGTPESSYPKILRWTREKGFELIAQEQPSGAPGERTENYYRLYDPRISGDGRVLVATVYRDCVSISACAFANFTQGRSWTASGGLAESGRAVVSANGRFVAFEGVYEPNRRGVLLLDFETGEQLEVPSEYSLGASPLTDDGRVLLAGPGNWIRGSKNGIQEVLSNAPPSPNAAINRNGKTIVYTRADSASPDANVALVAVDVSSGRQTVLVTALPLLCR